MRSTSRVVVGLMGMEVVAGKAVGVDRPRMALVPRMGRCGLQLRLARSTDYSHPHKHNTTNLATRNMRPTPLTRPAHQHRSSLTNTNNSKATRLHLKVAPLRHQ